jgi:putative DNA primase/helicase
MVEQKDFSDINFCYNCAEYNTKSKYCNVHHKEMSNFSTCINFNQRSDYNKKEVEEMDGKSVEKQKKKKISVGAIILDNYIQNVETFWQEQPFFYDKNGMFWLWNDIEKKYEMVDDVDMMNILDNILGLRGQTVNSGVKSNYLEAFKRVGRLKQPKEAPKKWIQFKDKAMSLESGNIYDIQPNYFFTNPIPYEIGLAEDTPFIDKLLEEWVGKKYVNTAYEIIAYCCLNDYPIHLIFCLVGCGRNGKSKFLGLINKFIGKDNICSTELDTLLDSRFESAKLYKKLVCVLGETNFGVISKTSLLKKLTGQDLIGFEFKNKKPFDDYSYAKILIASNSLPTTEDTSEGFYRRWLIINFDNIFNEGKDILKSIPEIEFANLAKKVSIILPRLIKKGSFSNQGSIDQRKERYIMASNPLSHFIDKTCEKGYDLFMRYSELFVAYRKYLRFNKKRAIGYREFNEILANDGFEVERTTKKVNGEFLTGKFILGVQIKSEWEKEVNMQIMQDMYDSTLLSLYRGIEGEHKHNQHKEHNNPKEDEIQDYEELLDPLIAHCQVCGKDPCGFGYRGKYFCSKECLFGYKAQNKV